MQPIPRAALFIGRHTPRRQPGRSPEASYAVLHPFASEPSKQWPADRFCEVARYLELWQIKPDLPRRSGRRRFRVLSLTRSGAVIWNRRRR